MNRLILWTLANGFFWREARTSPTVVTVEQGQTWTPLIVSPPVYFDKSLSGKHRHRRCIEAIASTTDRILQTLGKIVSLWHFLLVPLFTGVSSEVPHFRSSLFDVGAFYHFRSSWFPQHHSTGRKPVTWIYNARLTFPCLCIAALVGSIFISCVTCNFNTYYWFWCDCWSRVTRKVSFDFSLPSCCWILTQLTTSLADHVLHRI